MQHSVRHSRSKGDRGRSGGGQAEVTSVGCRRRRPATVTPPISRCSSTAWLPRVGPLHRAGPGPDPPGHRRGRAPPGVRRLAEALAASVDRARRRAAPAKTPSRSPPCAATRWPSSPTPTRRGRRRRHAGRRRQPGRRHRPAPAEVDQVRGALPAGHRRPGARPSCRRCRPAELRELRSLLATSTPARRARRARNCPAAAALPAPPRSPSCAGSTRRSASRSGRRHGARAARRPRPGPAGRRHLGGPPGRPGARRAPARDERPWAWRLLPDLVLAQHRAVFDGMLEDTSQAVAAVERARDAAPVGSCPPDPERTGAAAALPRLPRRGGRCRTYFRSGPQREAQPVLGGIRVGGRVPATADEVGRVVEYLELGEWLRRVYAGCAELRPAAAARRRRTGVLNDMLRGWPPRPARSARCGMTCCSWPRTRRCRCPTSTPAAQVAAAILESERATGRAAEAAAGWTRWPTGCPATPGHRHRPGARAGLPGAALAGRRRLRGRGRRAGRRPPGAARRAAPDDAAAAARRGRARAGHGLDGARRPAPGRARVGRVPADGPAARRAARRRTAPTWCWCSARPRSGVEHLLLTAVAPRMVAAVAPGERPGPAPSLLSVLQPGGRAGDPRPS